jgi:purine-binding chemotaxis protein CheW
MVGNWDFSIISNQEQTSSEFQELESPEGELHLRFLVASHQEFALPATGIREVIETPPDRITSIPNASPLLLGTLNWRGRVIWVADLGQFLGESKPLDTDRAEIPVIAVEDHDTMVGLAVDRIIGMAWLDIEQVQISTNVPDSMAPFLRGEWLLDKQTHQRLRLLDQMAIIRSARWAA